MCFSLGVQVVVSSFRVMMIGDNIFLFLIIARFLSRLCAGWLAELAERAESPRTHTLSRFPKIGRQQLLDDGTERASDIIRLTTHPFA